MTNESFELLLDTPELAIALIDGTLYASTMHTEATDDEILIAAATAAAHQLPPEPRKKLTPLDWTPPVN
ncbi:hypothetical protein AOZ07_03385 [Glutamicibacter halophytocola]|uniref:hypothetical protein n=1 Tax=Glutamicibacter halophytocola TaxID=1933880 RepID=UPI0006D4AF40|nr:hypothetical protein [Glutamicibacter halophytocola]ALG28132.1 hypothetical protein AOZ07_03385 [Glutamicibacter halophytocola]